MSLPEYAIKGMGWRPDPPDPRDRLFAPRSLPSLPPRRSLRSKVSGVFDQGPLGSCTANAVASMMRFVERRQGERSVPLSRLFIYYYTRQIEGTLMEDSGAYLRSTLKVVANVGAPPERLWPYHIERFRDAPPEGLDDDALEHQAIQYMRVPRHLQSMQACIAEGFPFVFGFAVHESFGRVGPDGVAPAPQPGEAILGWHAVTCTGYANTLYGGTGGFLCLNSWGKGWGDDGFFTLPYGMLLDPWVSADFWTIRSMS